MKNLKAIAIVVSAFALALVVFSGTASALRCGNNLVLVGDSKGEVLSKCGEPDIKDVLGEEKVNNVKLVVEEWFYDFGPHQLTKKLLFKGGKLFKIFDGPYGKKK